MRGRAAREAAQRGEPRQSKRRRSGSLSRPRPPCCRARGRRTSGCHRPPHPNTHTGAPSLRDTSATADRENAILRSWGLGAEQSLLKRPGSGGCRPHPRLRSNLHSYYAVDPALLDKAAPKTLAFSRVSTKSPWLECPRSDRAPMGDRAVLRWYGGEQSRAGLRRDEGTQVARVWKLREKIRRLNMIDLP